MTREYPTRPVVGVGAVVVVGAEDAARVGLDPAALPARGVVLVRRRFEPLAGQWSLPGGALDVGETLQAGTAREILEETGLAVDVGPVIEVFDRIMLDDEDRVRYHFVLIDYLCRPTGGRLEPRSDVSEAIVADPSALAPYALTDQARAVIARALALCDMMPVS
jgi:ADP-ribose pyrophosphatase YjhB (NUDIX family)